MHMLNNSFHNSTVQISVFGIFYLKTILLEVTAAILDSFGVPPIGESSNAIWGGDLKWKLL